jgi:hypothetical protein
MSVKNEILQAMAKAFFASAWADAREEAGQDCADEIMDSMPEEIDSAAIQAAETLCMGMERANNAKGSMLEFWDIAKLYNRACQIGKGQGDREHTPEMFGHYCAMQALGHGVGLWDAFGKDVYEAIKVPHHEFGSYSLSKDYF